MAALEGMNQESLMKQASQFWSMLDDMSESNPEAYRKFIEKQRQEAKEALKPPKPHMCIQTVLQGSAQRLFINVFEWNKVPAPKADEDPIPIMAGPLYQDVDDEGKHSLVSVAFSPEVLDSFGIDSNLANERRMLINLALDYLQDVQKLKPSRNYRLLSREEACKGSVETATKKLMQKVPSQTDSLKDELAEFEKSFGPLAAGCKDSVLEQLSNIASGGDDASSSSTSNPTLKFPGLSGKMQQGNKKLVQDMDFVKRGPVKPDYKIDLRDEEGEKPRRLVVRISLPEVLSVSQCELDISEKDLRLTVEDMYTLQLDFPERITENTAQAKFSKKTSTLIVTLPTVSRT